ncbi:MAG: 2-amino-4-hydroxy-6-hydroxymethyldihydropteridine diphosphokinase [Bdellovibrionales bacterium]|nr:2-amino-4-hydroxy-6-hydroxymethyldihydropteridine diphosphokinase [Bdellovibrionales bacterium]
MKALIALGANLGDRLTTLDSAVQLIEEAVGRVLAQSTWFENPALALPGDDASTLPSFLNGVIQVDTELDPEQVLSVLLEIECELGRDRSRERRKWAPREIDLDLLDYEQRQLVSQNLVLPHPLMHLRPFVLIPLCEVDPGWVHPILKKTARELLEAIPAAT